MAGRSAAGMEALGQAGMTATQALQDLSGEWVALARERVQRNMQMMEALSKCRTLPEIFALQGEWANANCSSPLREFAGSRKCLRAFAAQSDVRQGRRWAVDIAERDRARGGQRAGEANTARPDPKSIEGGFETDVDRAVRRTRSMMEAA